MTFAWCPRRGCSSLRRACRDQAAQSKQHQHSSPRPGHSSPCGSAKTLAHMAVVTPSISLLPLAFAAIFLTGDLVFCTPLWNQMTSFSLAPQLYSSSQRLFPVSSSHLLSSLEAPGPAEQAGACPASPHQPGPSPGPASGAPGPPYCLGAAPSFPLCLHTQPFCSLCLLGVLALQPVFPAHRPGVRPKFGPYLSHLLPGDLE